MIPFINLRAVQALKERRCFLARHLTRGEILWLGFCLGLSLATLVFALVTLALR
jgi:hypothetical protein